MSDAAVIASADIILFTRLAYPISNSFFLSSSSLLLSWLGSYDKPLTFFEPPNCIATLSAIPCFTCCSTNSLLPNFVDNPFGFLGSIIIIYFLSTPSCCSSNSASLKTTLKSELIVAADCPKPLSPWAVIFSKILFLNDSISALKSGSAAIIV